MKYLPKQDWSVVSRATLNDAAAPAADRQLALSAGNRLPIIYGRDRRRGSSPTLCPCRATSSCSASGGMARLMPSAIYLNDELVDNWQVNQTHYLGTPSQALAPWLRAAFAAKGIDYWDTLPGVAYSVFRGRRREV